MFDAYHPPITEPPALVQEVRKRRRYGKRKRPSKPTRRSRNTALFIGAIVVLTDDEGTEYDCQIYAFENGTWLCQPVSH